MPSGGLRKSVPSCMIFLNCSSVRGREPLARGVRLRDTNGPNAVASREVAGSVDLFRLARETDRRPPRKTEPYGSRCTRPAR